MTKKRILLIAVACAAIAAMAGPLRAEVVAEKLGSMPDASHRLGELVISADGRHMAMTQEDDASVTLYVDGEKKGTHAQIGAISISDDGRHSADWNCDGGQWAVEIDGKAVGHYPNNIGEPYLTHTPVVFSADGKHWAYSARSPFGWVFSLDGKESDPGGWVRMLRLSDDGAHYACMVDLGDDKQAAFLDGKRAAPLHASEQWVFTDDAQHWACVADVQPGPPARFPNPVNQIEQGRIVRDGVAGDLIIVDPWAPPIFVQHGSHIGYGNTGRIVVDAAARRVRDEPFAITFTPDMAHIAALLGHSDGMGTGSGVVVEHYYMWIDGKRIDSWSDVDHPASRPTSLSISADGAHAAVVFEERTVVVDGKVSGIYWNVIPPVFSADGKHVAYVGERPVPNANHLATDNAGVWELVADGKAVADYAPLRSYPVDSNFTSQAVPFCFSADDSLTFIGVKGRGIYRVTWKP